MKNLLFTELQNSKLDLDLFFAVSINHSSVRLIADYTNNFEQDLLKQDYVRIYNLYDKKRSDMLEYKKGNIEIVLSK